MSGKRGQSSASGSSSTTEFQELISNRIEEFVADITQLAREHAMQTLANALVMNDSAAGSRTTRSRAKGRLSGRGSSGGRHKRTQAELDEDKQRLLAAICAAPGQRMLDLAPALKTSAKQLALPARQLIAEKLVRTEGQKRSTAYFPSARGRKAQTS